MMNLRKAFQIKKDMYADLDDPNYAMKDFHEYPKAIQKELNTHIVTKQTALKRYRKVLPKLEANATEHPSKTIPQNLVTACEQTIAYIKDNSKRMGSKYYYILNDISDDPADDKVMYLRQPIIKRLIQKITMLVQINQYHHYKNLHGIKDILHREVEVAAKTLEEEHDPEKIFAKAPFIFLLSDTITRKYFMPLAKDDLKRFSDELKIEKKHHMYIEDDVKLGYQTDKKCVDDNLKGFYLVPAVGGGDMGAELSGEPLCPESMHAKSNKDVIQKLKDSYKDAKEWSFEDIMEELDYNDDTARVMLPIDFRTKWTGNFYNNVFDPDDFKDTNEDFKTNVYQIN